MLKTLGQRTDRANGKWVKITYQMQQYYGQGSLNVLWNGNEFRNSQGNENLKTPVRSHYYKLKTTGDWNILNVWIA